MGIKADAIARLYEFSAVNGCLGLAAFIVLHKYRYSEEGKICSNDLNLEDTEGLLPQRGQLL